MKEARPRSGVGRWIGRLPWTWATALHADWAWTLGQDPRRLCRRLALRGWELWPEVDAEPGGPRLAVPRVDAWAVALWSVAYYRGPVILVEGSGEGGIERRIELSREPGSGDGRAYRVFLEADGAAADVRFALRAERRGKGFEVALAAR